MPSRAGALATLQETGQDFIRDECHTMAASLSYYTIFALPALLVLLLLIVGAVLDPEDVRGALEAQIRSVLGPAGAEQVRTIIANAQRPAGGGLTTTILSLATLLLGATGAFLQLQSALNKAWDVKPDPRRSGVKVHLLKRLVSLGMVLAIAFLLLASLALSTALSALSRTLGGELPGGLSGPLAEAVDFAVSLGVITLLFAALYKLLPDAKIAWRDVWIGALGTALLFTIGKFILGIYLGRSHPGQAFGAAASLALLLVWIYYSAIIALLGAEFTQVWAVHHGHGLQPKDGAVRADRKPRQTRSTPPEPERRRSGERRRRAPVRPGPA